MILTTKALMIAGLGAVSAIGVASAAYRWQQASAEQEQAVREADRHLMEGTAPSELHPPQPPQRSNDPQDMSSEMPTLNADEYRQEITDIDRLIFEQPPMTKERATSLSKKLEELAKRIASSSNTRFIAIEADELRKLATFAIPSGSNASRATLENNWMRIRNNVFDDRSWFARSAADLEPTAETYASPEMPKRPADPFIPEEPLSNVGKQGLEGRWTVKAIFGNGKPTSDPELANSLWMFDRNHLFISGQNSHVSHYTFTEINDERGAALHLEPDSSNEGPAEEGWMNYEFAGSDLKLAFFDGLGQRPDGFTAPEGKRDPLFLLVILQRAR